MPSALRELDHAVFHRLNVAWSSRVLDSVVPALTDANRSPWFWLALAAILGAWIWRERGRALRMIVALAAAVAASDLLCYRVIKPFFHRLRPEFVLPDVVLRAGHHGRYGFPSNHAANSFAAATLLAAFYPRLAAPAFLLAAFIGYTRVYVGAHFPLDVVGGAAIGAAIGGLVAWLCRTGGLIDAKRR